MRINITKTENATHFTHGGMFHADDVLATVMLSKIGSVNVARVFKLPDSISEGTIIYDIGSEYDPKKSRFDHHQKSAPRRGNGILYSSCGQIWKEYATEILLAMGCPADCTKTASAIVDKRLIVGIDAQDNGISPAENMLYISESFSGMINNLNPCWDEKTSSDECFLKACDIADMIFSREVAVAISKAKAESIVERKINEAKNGIMVLDYFVPWTVAVLKSENEKAKDILYVIFPSNRGGYNVQCVPDKEGSFGFRKSIPESWKGNPNATGVSECTFVHASGFIMACSTFDGAVSLAEKAVSEN